MGFGEIYVVKIGFRELVLVTAQGHEANPKSANLLLKGRGASVELREAPGFWGLEINFRSFFLLAPRRSTWQPTPNLHPVACCLAGAAFVCFRLALLKRFCWLQIY